jgi:RNA polymerase sigma factor (sigma-70 family)
MASGPLPAFLRHLRRLAARQETDPLSDRQLLDRFATRRDETAFAALVERHGPSVLAVGRRVLHDRHAAEDVFQATFLVLARKAASIRKRTSIASWLYGVAHRLAVRAKTQVATRSLHEHAQLPRSATDPAAEVMWRELGAVLDEELARLPEKVRAPLVLCYLEGKTQEAAARQLGWAVSTLHRRLERGRDLLRVRLERRGVLLSTGLLATALSQSAASAAVSVTLVDSTIEAALAFGMGEVLAATATAPAVTLAKGALHAMFVTKLKLLAVAVVSVGFFGVGAGMLTQQILAEKQAAGGQLPVSKAPAQAAEEPKPAPKPQDRHDQFGDPLPPGARARLGTVRLRLGETICQFAFSPDGKTLAVASNDERVSLWDVATRREIRRPEFRRKEHNPNGGITGVAFSPDNKVLAAAQFTEILRWDVRTGAELSRFHLKSVRFRHDQLLYSPDGQILACLLADPRGDPRTQAVFLDAATGRELHRLDGPPCIAFAPDGKTWAYAAGSDNTVGLCESRTGRKLRRFEGHAGQAKTVAFSPDGRTLASTDYGGALRFWNTTTGELQPRQGSFEAQISLAYSPDGKRLAGCTDWRRYPGEVPVVYDIAAGKQLPALISDRFGWNWNEPRGMAALFSPDGKVLASGYAHCLYLWDVATLQSLQTGIAHESQVSAIAFLSDGSIVTSAAAEKGVYRRWEAGTGKALPPLCDPYDGQTHAYAPDGRTMAVGTGNDGRGTIWLLETATGKPGKPGRALWNSDGEVYSAMFAADGRTLAADRGKETRLWDLTTGEVRQTIQGGALDGRNFALAPDGRYLVQGDSATGVIRLYETATGKESRTLQGDRAGVHAVAFHLDGKTFASSGFDHAVKLWDVATGQQLWLAEGHQGRVHVLAFSPDGKSLASAGADRAVRLWEVMTGKERWRFDGHGHKVATGVFSRDGKQLATGSADTTVLIWNLTAPAGLPARSPLSAPELDGLWADLAGEDAHRAYSAIYGLAGAPAQALPLLRDRLRPIADAPPGQLKQLITTLDSPQFEQRETARQELLALDNQALPALREALQGKPSLEQRRRIEQILNDLRVVRAPEVLRPLRAVEVLERIASAEAREILERLARGAPEARLTQETKAALHRLAHRAKGL